MTKEGTEDKRQAGVSESVKAAVPSSLLGALRGVEAQAEETFARPADTKPLELREAALQWLADATPHAVFTPDAPALTLVSVRDEQLEALAAEHAQYKIEKGAALAKVAALLATATDPDDIRALKDLMEQIGDAKTLSAIHAITANLPAAITVAVSKDGQGDAFTNDKEFQAAVRDILNQAERIRTDSKENFAKADRYARENGYADDEHDKNIANRWKQIEDEKDPLKKLELQRKLYEDLEKHYKEMEQRALAKGDSAGAETFRISGAEVAEKAKDGTAELFEKMKQEALKAIRRNLESRNDLSPEQIEEQIAIRSKQMGQKYDINGKDNEQLKGLTAKLKEEIEAQKKNNDKKPADIPVTPELPNNTQIKILLAEGNAEKPKVILQVQTVSASENVSPHIVPTTEATAPKKLGLE